MSESADAVQMHEIPAVVPQPQPVLEMCHSFQNGGGHVAEVRDVHRAGAHDRQHHRVDGCTLRCDDHGVAVAVFPTYMGVYVTCVCSYQHASLPEQLDQVCVAAVICVLPPLHTDLHHRHVHLVVRGEDLAAEERNLHL